MIKFTIPIEPRTKKNSSQIVHIGGRACIVPSKIYKQYERDCLYLIPKEARQGINTAVNVKAVYYRGSERRCDISNLHAALHDILVKACVLEDDNFRIIVSTDGSRVRVDREHPRTEIEITEVKE